MRRVASNKKDVRGEENWIKEYKNGIERAIGQPIFGIKSRRKTRRAKKRAYSIPKKNITT
jgi:hypothetical protein